MSQITTTDLAPEALSKLMLEGDLSKLTPEQRVQFYQAKCEHVGLDPSALPFQYIKLQGKLTLYASKGCAEQLRKKHKISLSNMQMDSGDGYITVTIDASTADGRTDTDCGSVSTEGLKGEMLANAKLKAVTKAKRRVTLSLLGLGMLDESEVMDTKALRDMRYNAEVLHSDAVPAPAKIFKPEKSNEPSFQDAIIKKDAHVKITPQDLDDIVEEYAGAQDESMPFDVVEAVKELKTKADVPFWAIKFRGDEEEYTTFKQEHADKATELMERGSGCQFGHKQNGKYYNLTSIHSI